MARLEFPTDFNQKTSTVQHSIMAQLQQLLNDGDIVLLAKENTVLQISDYQTLQANVTLSIFQAEPVIPVAEETDSAKIKNLLSPMLNLSKMIQTHYDLKSKQMLHQPGLQKLETLMLREALQAEKNVEKIVTILNELES